MTSSASPLKLASRNLPPASDTNFFRSADSPERQGQIRPLRKLQSLSQLSSTQTTSFQRPNRTGLGAKPSKEQSDNIVISTRSRSNSDIPVPFERQQRPVQKQPLVAIPPLPPPNIPGHVRKSSLEMTLKDGPPPGSDPVASLALLRHSVLTSRVDATKEGMSDYRIYLWLSLLNVPPLSTDIYLNLIHRGRSPAYEKISNDVFRTLTTDALFKRRVTDASLTRVLNATAWRIHDDQQSTPSDSPSIQAPYIQGVNVLSAPLLYASRSECQAYALLTELLTTHIPSYLSPTMSGVHAGLDLIDRILATINPTLSNFLLSKSLPAKIYAFPSVLTLCACTPPLPEVLRLWDFLFAFGTHLNIICVVAQLLLLKDTLLGSPSPAKILRNFPQLNSEEIIKMTLLIVRDLPDDLYEELVNHAKV